MIQRIDRLGVELPPPSDPDPNGAAAVQELMGGRFGEMSTLMNYLFQSINFRGRQQARPFYDLVANIAAEEWGHVELVGATINTMLTGASPVDDGKAPNASLSGVKDARMSQHYLLGGQGALPFDSQGKPWTGDNVFPVAEHPDGEDPRVPAAHRRQAAPEALQVLPERLSGAGRGVQRAAPGDGRGAGRGG
jgi:Mn-containing catalase